MMWRGRGACHFGEGKKNCGKEPLFGGGVWLFGRCCGCWTMRALEPSWLREAGWEAPSCGCGMAGIGKCLVIGCGNKAEPHHEYRAVTSG